MTQERKVSSSINNNEGFTKNIPLDMKSNNNNNNKNVNKNKKRKSKLKEKMLD